MIIIMIIIRKTGNLLPRARGIGKSSRISSKSGVPANDAGDIIGVSNASSLQNCVDYY